MADIREQLVALGRLMFERCLTDTAGGNISARQGDTIYISPRYAGSRQHWQLAPDDIVAGAVATDEVLSHPRFSREGKAHLAIYRAFPGVNGVIHAHSFHILPFCATGTPIEPLLEQTLKFGTVPVIEAAPAHSVELAERVVRGLQGQEEAMARQAAAVLVPQHGIIVAGKDVLAAFDALERIDWNAWCVIARRWLA